MSTVMTATVPTFTVGADAYTFTIPAALFVASVKATATAAGSDASLPVFTYASFTVFDDGGWEIATTDRYRLAVASTCVVESASPVSTAIVPMKALLTFGKGIKVPARGSVPDVSVMFTTDMVSVSWNGASASWLRSELPDADMFPNYRKLMANTYTPGDTSVSYWNPDFLADGAEACRHVSAGKNIPVCITLTDANKPAVLSPQTLRDGLSRFTYLLMPVRIR